MALALQVRKGGFLSPWHLHNTSKSEGKRLFKLSGAHLIFVDDNARTSLARSCTDQDEV